MPWYQVSKKKLVPPTQQEIYIIIFVALIALVTILYFWFIS